MQSWPELPLATMSSTSSKPGNWDTTRRPRLGLDAVIQVSRVAALPVLGPRGTQGRAQVLSVTQA